MKGAVEERAVELGEYIIENNATVRAAAKKFQISKSTVHTDVMKRDASLCAHARRTGERPFIPRRTQMDKAFLHYSITASRLQFSPVGSQSCLGTGNGQERRGEAAQA